MHDAPAGDVGGVHPGGSGYSKIAQAWFDAVSPVLKAGLPVPVEPVDPRPQEGKPDLIIADFSWEPANFTANSDVFFKATIKNQGTVATPAGIVSGISFWVDGTLDAKAYQDTCKKSIAPGDSITLSTMGSARPLWAAAFDASSGGHTVCARVNDLMRYDEAIFYNNTLSKACNEPGFKARPKPEVQTTPVKRSGAPAITPRVSGHTGYFNGSGRKITTRSRERPAAAAIYGKEGVTIKVKGAINQAFGPPTMAARLQSGAVDGAIVLTCIGRLHLQ
jgi:hypothetical protein